MSESVQAVLALLMIVGMFGSVLVFLSDRVPWGAFAGFLSLMLGSSGLLLWSLLRRDRVPDHLKQLPGGAFERDGLCFKVIYRVAGGVCHLDLYFQTRYDRASRGMILLQPAQGFWLNRPRLRSMTLEVGCPPGGAGVVSLPWAIPAKFQGKKQALDVGADVFYPGGRGKMIRFKGGVQVRTAGFDTWRTVMTAAGAMGGMIVLSRPAQLKIKLPQGVAETVASDAPVTQQIFWSLDDAAFPNSDRPAPSQAPAGASPP